MPTTGPIYNRLANGYEGLLRGGLRFPKTAVVLALLAVVPGWWLVPPHGDGVHARHGRGGVRARLRDAGRHLAGPDRQGHAAGRGHPAAHARHLRLHPPDRGRARVLRHRSVHRRHPGQPQAAGQPPADGRDLRGPPRGTRGRGPRAGDRVRPACPGPDRRPGGRRQPDRGEGLRPRLRRRSASWPNRSGRSSRRSPAPSTSTPTSTSATPTSWSAPTASRPRRSG